ncbi:histidine kinase [Phycicoccus sp. M110.8]|uniref:histidine kinase n=1 Tax=Phycicoccus sp. M110.8 TaxID=3075433 RepID=UPI0028FD616C|nr:histidine kinase [Phycicoccus sp. M110.8]MDU0312654.1 histidine kinase [Phycicoccus sp. M110.8]
MKWMPHLAVSTRLRLAFALLAGMFAYIDGNLLAGLPWILLVLTLDLTAAGLAYLTVLDTAVRRAQVWALLCGSAVVAGLAMGYASGWAKLLVLIPAYHAGTRFRHRGAVVVPALSAPIALLTAWQLHRLDPAEAVSIGLAVLLALLFGMLGAWSHALEPEAPPVDANVAAEAGLLLRRLHELADTLDTGFDAPASAEMALQDLASQMRAARSAILVGYGTDPAVPLAIRGADRTPWPDPTEPGSVLGPAWNNGTATLTEWTEDLVGRSLLAVPLNDENGQRMGLLVADRPLVTPFTADDLDAAVVVAERHSTNIDLSVLFAGLRERAGLEERERLAREMHDGIAQEMVALGFGIDSLRRTARNQGSALADDLDGLREEVSRVLADLRLHIADLRIAVRPDTGLGAMIGARLQNFGSSSGVTTRMHLSENGFRLPAHTEVLIYRLFLQVLADARHSLNATTVEVRLNVAAPRVELWMGHNGTSSLTERDFTDNPLTGLGGEIVVEPYAGDGVAIRMRMRGRGGAPSATLSNERIPQPS